MTSADPEKLIIHPALAGMPMLPETAPEYLALLLSLKEHGSTRPVLITPEGEVVDGRHLRRAAIALGLSEVPVQVVKGEQVASLIVATLVARRHYGVGARVYLAWPLVSENTRANRKARGGDRKSTELTFDPATAPQATWDDWCQRLGCSRETLSQAQTLHKLLADKPAAVREKIEGALLSGHIGLGPAIQQASLSGNEGRKPEPEDPATRSTIAIDLWRRGLKAVKDRLPGWERLTQEHRREAVAGTVELLAEFPQDAQREALKALRRMTAGKGKPKAKAA